MNEPNSIPNYLNININKDRVIYDYTKEEEFFFNDTYKEFDNTLDLLMIYLSYRVEVFIRCVCI